MMMIREETRALMQQLRRSLSSRASPAGVVRHVAPLASTSPASAIAGQQRHHLIASTTPTSKHAPLPPNIFHTMSSRLPAIPEDIAVAVRPHVLARCMPINNGKQLVLEFSDHTRFEVHSAWLRDASPSNRGPDFYRTSAADVWKLGDLVVREAEPKNGGEQMAVTFEAAGEKRSEVFEARWLKALAPFVGKALNGAASAAEVQGTGSLLEALHQRRSPWMSDVEMPKFDAGTLVSSLDAQVDFLERMVDPGIALITNIGLPESLDREVAGKPMLDVVFEVIGRTNQHPVRSTSFGVMRKTAESAKQGADYDMSNPLSMHTDHSVYQGTPGYLQFLYQAQGSVRSKVCDGLALAEHVRIHHPKAFELLTTVHITHSSRNVLYTKEGKPRNVYDKGAAPAPFELVHTHPVIQLDAQGFVEKVVQSETKRGVCALPYDVYGPFMEAYELWTRLCEDPRFIKQFDWPEGTMVVTNNWRTLHGRASVPPEMARTMCFSYVNKILVENRYRLLKQLEAERNHGLHNRWLTCMPNQVLGKLVE